MRNWTVSRVLLLLCFLYGMLPNSIASYRTNLIESHHVQGPTGIKRSKSFIAPSRGSVFTPFPIQNLTEAIDRTEYLCVLVYSTVLFPPLQLMLMQWRTWLRTERRGNLINQSFGSGCCAGHCWNTLYKARIGRTDGADRLLFPLLLRCPTNLIPTIVAKLLYCSFAIPFVAFGCASCAIKLTRTAKGL